MAKKFKRAKISFLSLCPRGANELPGLYKSEGTEWAVLTKQPTDFDEKGQLTSLVYVPNREDSQGHLADSAVIEKMAHSFMEEGAQVDLVHNRRPLKKEQAYIAESFIVQEGDPRFADQKDAKGNPVDATGGWAVVTQINDPALRKAYREGNWDGVSLFSYGGDYEFEAEESVSKEFVKKALEDFHRNLTQSEDLNMDKKELLDLLKENNEALLKTFNESLKKEESSDDSDDNSEDVGLVFDGDPTNLVELEKFERKLTLHNLQKEYDFSDPKQIAEYRSKVESLTKSDENDEGDESDSEEAYLRKQIEDLTKDLNAKKRKPHVPVEKGKDFTASGGLSAEDMEALEAGKAIAKIANKKRGIN